MTSSPPPRLALTACSLALVSVLVLGAGSPYAELPDDLTLEGDIEAGRIIATTRAKGNCVACHVIAGAESPGAIGPVLIAIQTRYPDKRALAEQIWDPTAQKPDMVMPPFGKHEILTEQEFADVVEFVWSL
ncbi:sulfur oxidation c-type cytochrome SoxX [Marichromatium bheemlicum]|uniref:Sulfur oxidation c-type cytochrome SoxX n=1 Tax=Marichromatium bheemlicum TaxID=365339 RepID=A0ABX1IB19_9GAMM|nr:sulfur oxidation c-type cytochrome SoxX [Marichromatium bheemlicum]NKN34244.1 sulfur oxidation c-type cytochrome SoxX [Marichromatium bheemlicum]